MPMVCVCASVQQDIVVSLSSQHHIHTLCDSQEPETQALGEKTGSCGIWSQMGMSCLAVNSRLLPKL